MNLDPSALVVVQADFHNLVCPDRLHRSSAGGPSPVRRNHFAAFGILAEEDEWVEVGHSWEAPGEALTELMGVVVRIHD